MRPLSMMTAAAMAAAAAMGAAMPGHALQRRNATLDGLHLAFQPLELSPRDPSAGTAAVSKLRG